MSGKGQSGGNSSPLTVKDILSIQQGVIDYISDEKNRITKKAGAYLTTQFAAMAKIATDLNTEVIRSKAEAKSYCDASKNLGGELAARLDVLIKASSQGVDTALLMTEVKLCQESSAKTYSEVSNLRTQVSKAASDKLVEVSTRGKQSPATPPTPRVIRSQTSTLRKATTSKTGPKFSLLVKPKAKIDVKVLKSSFLGAVDPVGNKLKLDSVRMVFSKSWLVIKTGDAKTKEYLLRVSNATFTVVSDKLKNPMMVVRNVPRDIPEKEISRAIHLQNFPELEPGEFKDSVKLSFRTGDRKRSAVDWVIETCPKIRSQILERPKLYIEASCCKVEDFLRLRRCFKCQGFGHSSTKCRRGPKCSHCAGDHKIADCPNMSEVAVCINCKLQKRESHSHEAQVLDCPSRMAAIQREISSIDYGTIASRTN